MYNNKKIGLVIPAYNEEKFISIVIEKIPEYIDFTCVVDDASDDATSEIVSRLNSGNEGRIKLVRHERNQGVGKAIVTGYKCCLEQNMDVSVVMAGDNQMDPVHLPLLLDPIINGEADYTIGNRISSLEYMKSMSYWRRLGNFGLTWATKIAAWNFHVGDSQNGYTAVTQRALKNLDLNNIHPRYGYCNDMIIKLSAIKTKIKHIAIPAVYGSEKSKIRYRTYIPTLSWILVKGFILTIRMRLLFRNKSTCRVT